MQSPIPETRAAEAAQISQAVAEFERNGGKIERVPILIGQTYDTWRAYVPSEGAPPPVAKPKTRKEQAKRGYDVRQAHAVKSAKARAERDAVAVQIRTMATAGEKTVDIAKVLGIAPRTVRRTAAENGIALNTQTGRRGSMHPDTVRAIRAAVEARMTYKDAAKHYGCSVPAVRDIVSGVTYGHVI